MKRGLALALFLIIILSVYTVSAEILIIQQPSDIYNLGDVITLPVTIKTANDVTGVFKMSLLCAGHTNEFYVNGVSLESGEEKKFEASLVLTRNVIGELKGNCKIKASLGDEFALTKDFEISNTITINLEFEKTSFDPNEQIILEGSAVKANGQDVEGFIQLSIKELNNTGVSKLETIDNGFFKINTTLPKDLASGKYLLKLEAYEQDSSKTKTNIGTLNENIWINQIPTSLEVVFEEKEIEPGESFRVKSVLYDQTGEKISNRTSFITIKNQDDKILEQKEVKTNEYIEYPVPYDQPPTNWNVVAVSSKLNAESNIKILEKEAVDIQIMNKTISIENTGNVPYNKTVLVKVGEEPLNIPVYLEVGEEKKYTLSAPDGEYTVEVNLGNESISDSVLLTGKSISVKEASSAALTLIRYPIVWIFLIALLGFVAFVVFRRNQKQSVFGYIGSKVKPKRKKNFQNIKGAPVNKNSLVNSRNPAQLSLSIKGNKQSSVMVGLHIKNLSKLQSHEGGAKETLQNIIDLAEKEKASTYETGSHIFFILAPVKTRTFDNEKTGLKIATQIKEFLKEHNRKFKTKIDYGISLTRGDIVAKQESEEKSGKTILKFMSLGNFLADSKKLSTHSKGEIFLDENSNSRLKESLKTKKHGKEKKYYTIEEVKNVEENKRFLRSFLNRLEHGDKKSSDSEKPVERE